MLKRLVFATVVLGALPAAGVAGWWLWQRERTRGTERPDIPFAPRVDSSLQHSDNAEVRVDLARVEREYPLSRVDLMKLTPANLRALSQEEIDQIYGRLSAGPIPDGPYRGDLFFAPGDSFRIRLEQILGGIGGRIAARKIKLLEAAGRMLWKGKMFYRDQRVVRNLIGDLGPIRPLIDDPDALMVAEIPRDGLLGRILPTTSVWQLFPAKLYCGRSLFDGRRDSLVIDYDRNDEIAGYRASPDSLVGRDGLRIRDEIRMIRPGFYLGRAYANRMFVLNFTLCNRELADAGAEAFAAGEPNAEDCWIGGQVRRAAAR